MGEKGCALFYNCPSLSGFTEEDVLFMTVKELMDNAIDACRHQKTTSVFQETCTKRIAVEILFDPWNTLCEETREHSMGHQSNVLVKVQDNGAGVVDGTIEHLGTLFGSSFLVAPSSATVVNNTVDMFSKKTKRHYGDSGFSPETWLGDNNATEEIPPKSPSVQETSQCALSGKFGQSCTTPSTVCTRVHRSDVLGLGLKMVLLASSRGGPGQLHFKIRASDTSTADFALKLHEPHSHPTVKVSNLSYATSLYKDWPWMTCVSVEIPCTDIVDIRLFSYFDLVALWNPQIRLSFTYDASRWIQGESDSQTVDYTSWFAQTSCHDQMSRSGKNSSKTSTIQAYWNLKTPASLQQRFSEKLSFHYNTLLAQTTLSQNGVDIFLFLCRQSPDSKQSPYSAASYPCSQSPSDVSEHVTFWCWRSCNRVPLVPGDCSICLITKSFVKFYKRWGSHFGFLKNASQGFFPCDASRLSPHQTFYSMASVMEGVRVSFATWTDLLMLINLDMEDLQYGSLNKSFLRGPDKIENDIIQLLVKGFKELQQQCGEASHELISIQKAQYMDAVFHHAPNLASSLASLINNSTNSLFKERLEKFLKDTELKQQNDQYSSSQDVGSSSDLEQTLLSLILHRLHHEHQSMKLRPAKKKK